MAKDLFRTPIAPVRWAHLITPRHQLADAQVDVGAHLGLDEVAAGH